MKITIVGIGALGSHLVQALRNEKATLRVIDDDRVEIKNVASQFHFKGGVGKKKVDALKQAMDFSYGLKLEVIGNRLVDDNAIQLLGGSDLIVDCVDNGATRRLIQEFARATKIPCVHGALAADGSFGRVIWTEQFVVDDEGGTGVATCEDGAFLPFIMLVSSYLALAVQRWISGRKIGFSVAPTHVEIV